MKIHFQHRIPFQLLTGSESSDFWRFHLMGASPDQRLDDLDFCMTTAFVNVSYNS